MLLTEIFWSLQAAAQVIMCCKHFKINLTLYSSDKDIRRVYVFLENALQWVLVDLGYELPCYSIGIYRSIFISTVQEKHLYIFV
jgi:hypothetical protein